MVALNFQGENRQPRKTVEKHHHGNREALSVGDKKARTKNCPRQMF
jgi:hypothetical protein